MPFFSQADLFANFRGVLSLHSHEEKRITLLAVTLRGILEHLSPTRPVYRPCSLYFGNSLIEKDRNFSLKGIYVAITDILSWNEEQG